MKDTLLKTFLGLFPMSPDVLKLMCRDLYTFSINEYRVTEIQVYRHRYPFPKNNRSVTLRYISIRLVLHLKKCCIYLILIIYFETFSILKINGKNLIELTNTDCMFCNQLHNYYVLVTILCICIYALSLG